MPAMAPAPMPELPPELELLLPLECWPGLLRRLLRECGGDVNGGGGGAGLVLQELPSVLQTDTSLVQMQPSASSQNQELNKTYCRLFIFFSSSGIQPVKRLFATFLHSINIIRYCAKYLKHIIYVLQIYLLTNRQVEDWQVH